MLDLTTYSLLVTAARNAMSAPRLSTQLNSELPPKTYTQLKAELANEAGDGKTLYENIIAAAKQQTRELGCFVAGTLVHTREGLRPIEQIKVGDYVLSKPESGEGKQSYQRVTRTYEYEDREVYFVGWHVLDAATDKATSEQGFVVVTGGHPLWVEGIENCWFEDHIRQTRFTEVNAWLSVEALYKLLWEATWLQDEDSKRVSPILHLTTGQKASLEFVHPVLQAPENDVGVVFMDYEFWKDNHTGPRIDFAPDGPNMPRNERGRWMEVHLEVPDVLAKNVDSLAMDALSIFDRSEGFFPIRRSVFNIEVENNHTYYVAEAGLWVHNTSGIQKTQLSVNPAKPIGVYVGVGGK